MRGGENSRNDGWRVHAPDTGEFARQLREELGLEPLLADLLLRRGVDTVEAGRRFLNPSLEHPHDPFLLLGMDEAVSRIARALAEKELILISGDYDVDGITSSALLAQFLHEAGCTRLQTFIPNRFEHGYGLTSRGVDELISRRPALVITVDNGITAIEEVARLRAEGIDTIITDHHLPREEGIPAGIVVNPRQPGCTYPFKGISGCGVTFKLITALRKILRGAGWWNSERPEPNLKDYLDLVAIGTVADVVPLLDENRVFVRFGLQVLNRGVNRPGVAALLAVSRVDREIDARTIAYRIAPRINAAGRMAEGSLAVEMLLAREPGRAEELAQLLDEENTKRRGKEKEMLREAEELVSAADGAGAAGIVVASPNFHEGIIGIIASRLVSRFGVPAVVLAENGNFYKGSARTVEGINVTEALTACAPLLEEYGGHAGAAGCRLEQGRLEEFTSGFAQACAEQSANGAVPETLLDGRLRPEEINDRLVEQITRLAPFGQENEQPSFLLEAAHLPEPPQVLAERHLKWRVGPGIEMLAWNQAEALEPGPRDCYRVTLGFNEFRGVRKIQLVVEEVRHGEG